jgi:monoamine oxidase
MTTAAAGPSADLRRAHAVLDGLAKEVPLDRPWSAARAKEWDAVTVADWLKRNKISGEARDEFTLDCQTELGEPEKISLLYYLFYVHSAGGHQALTVDAQKSRLVGGPQSLSRKMADGLGADGVVLSSPVRTIEYRDAGRVIVTSARVRVVARRVIVAMMPADVRRIEFVPALPAERAGLIKGWVGSPAIKVNVVYARPFWRDAGLSGLGVADAGVVGVTFDNSPDDASRGVRVAFLNVGAAPKNAAERRAAVLAGLVRLFGKGAGATLGYYETDWQADRLSSGCVSPLPPGLLTRFGAALRTAVGPIHWAGTETSEVWAGYMDGAVRAGRRAAGEVDRLL